MDQPGSSGDVGSGGSEGFWLEPPSDQPERLQPRTALWPYYLFFRPKVFFQHFVLSPAPALTALAAWMLGISGAIDEVGMRGVMADQEPLFWPVKDWDNFWIACFSLGMVGGLLYFVIGGWWFRLRLRFSGAGNPDKPLARRVYLFASQVCALPTIFWTLSQALRYETPTEAIRADEVREYVTLLFLYWSIYTSYRGVRTAFEVRRWAARFWFVILPGLFYGLLLMGLLVVLIAEGFARPPLVDQPERIDRPGFTLEYPGNWYLDTEPPDYDPDRRFALGLIFVDAMVTMEMLDTLPDPQSLLDERVAEWAEDFTIRSRQRFDCWGDYPGEGLAFIAEMPFFEYQVRLFVASGEQGGFAVEQYADTNVYENQKPGFELIERTFCLKGQ